MPSIKVETGLYLEEEMQNQGRGHQEGLALAKACLAYSSLGAVGCGEQRNFRLSRVCEPGQSQLGSPKSCWGGVGGWGIWGGRALPLFVWYSEILLAVEWTHCRVWLGKLRGPQAGETG